MKSKYLPELRALYLADFRKRHPDFPGNAIPSPKFKLTDTNSLTESVAAYVGYRGGRLFRVNVQGQYDAKLGQWRKSGAAKGLPDLVGTGPGGQFLGVEIKFGRDTLSKDQIKVHDQIRETGGIVIVCRDFDQFCNDFINTFDNFVTSKQKENGTT